MGFFGPIVGTAFMMDPTIVKTVTQKINQILGLLESAMDLWMIAEQEIDENWEIPSALYLVLPSGLAINLLEPTENVIEENDYEVEFVVGSVVAFAIGFGLGTLLGPLMFLFPDPSDELVPGSVNWFYYGYDEVSEEWKYDYGYNFSPVIKYTYTSALIDACIFSGIMAILAGLVKLELHRAAWEFAKLVLIKGWSIVSNYLFKKSVKEIHAEIVAATESVDTMRERVNYVYHYIQDWLAFSRDPYHHSMPTSNDSSYKDETP